MDIFGGSERTSDCVSKSDCRETEDASILLLLPSICELYIEAADVLAVLPSAGTFSPVSRSRLKSSTL